MFIFCQIVNYMQSTWEMIWKSNGIYKWNCLKVHTWFFPVFQFFLSVLPVSLMLPEIFWLLDRNKWHKTIFFQKFLFLFRGIVQASEEYHAHAQCNTLNELVDIYKVLCRSFYLQCILKTWCGLRQAFFWASALNLSNEVQDFVVESRASQIWMVSGKNEFWQTTGLA